MTHAGILVRAAVVAALIVAPGLAHASRAITGTIFFDRDQDGVVSSGDEALTSGHVFWETAADVAIDAGGTYSLTAPDQAGIVWVRGSDASGLAPGPFWAAVPAAGDQVVDIPVRAQTATGDFSFVIASDTHAGIAAMPASDQSLVLRQATNIEPRPYFIAVTGDITQSNKPEHFATVLDAIDSLDVPYVPIPGNHDWYDGGAAYRAHLGPPSYSFAAGGVRFIVLNDADSLGTRLTFVSRDLALARESGSDPTVVALMHAPPRDPLLFGLEDLGVDYLFTGHLHANRVLVHDSLIEYNTQPLAMGGIDLTPAGYRVFSVAADGTLRSVHHTIVNQPILRIQSPVADQIVPPCQLRIIAGLEAGATVTGIEARIAGVAGMDAIGLGFVGGWSYESATLPLCDPGTYALTVEARLADGTTLVDSATITVDERPDEDATVRDWPMLRGTPDHRGVSPVITGYPLRPRWTTTVGGHVAGGAPVVADGRVFVPVSDLGEGTQGGVVALDARTGEQIWQRRVGYSVRNAPAVAGGIVVFAANDGTVHAVDAATGEDCWRYALAPQAEVVSRNIYAAPIIVDGVVYVGVRRELVAIDLQSGDVLWSVIPIDSSGDLASHVTPAVGLGLLVMAFDRGHEGLMAFDMLTGERVWQTGPEVSLGMQGSPVIAGETVYVVNETTQVTALSLLDGSVRWSIRLDERGFGWGYCAVATPAYDNGILYAGTQFGELHALDASTGSLLWTHEVAPALIRASHYRGEIAAASVAPTLTPGLLWTGGPDGVLRAIYIGDGQEQWSLDLGVPILASPVPAGDSMFVASYDGTVRALATEPAFTPPPAGGCHAAGRDGAPALALLLLLRLLLRRRGARKNVAPRL